MPSCRVGVRSDGSVSRVAWRGATGGNSRTAMASQSDSVRSAADSRQSAPHGADLEREITGLLPRAFPSPGCPSSREVSHAVSGRGGILGASCRASASCRGPGSRASSRSTRRSRRSAGPAGTTSRSTSRRSRRPRPDRLRRERLHPPRGRSRRPILINGKKKRRAVLGTATLVLGDVELTFSLFDETHTDDERPDEGDARAHELAGLRALAALSRRLLALPSILEQIDALIDAVIEVTHAAQGLRPARARRRPAHRRRAQRRRARRCPTTSPSSPTASSVACSRRGARSSSSDALADTMFGASESVMDLQLCVGDVRAAHLAGPGHRRALRRQRPACASLFEQSSSTCSPSSPGRRRSSSRTRCCSIALRGDANARRRARGRSASARSSAPVPSMLEVFRKLQKVATTDISVLITGETGHRQGAHRARAAPPQSPRGQARSSSSTAARSPRT